VTSPSATRLLQAALGCLLVLAPADVSAQTTDDLFSTATLQRLDLEVHSSDWAKLQENFQTNTYYPADFVWNGQTVRNVGIRSRGRGSRNAHKPGLKIDFDRYSTNQKFLGLKSLVLDNLTQDPSGIHETVSMRFYQRLGIPTPRETHVRLYVRGEYIGLYALVHRGMLHRCAEQPQSPNGGITAAMLLTGGDPLQRVPRGVEAEADGLREDWIEQQESEDRILSLGISTSDGSYWRYDSSGKRGIEPARPEEVKELKLDAEPSWRHPQAK